jgi:hypothetical protein
MRMLSTAIFAALATAMSASAGFADEVVVIHRSPVTQSTGGYPDSYGVDGYSRGWSQAEANNRAAMRLQDDLSSQRASQR